MSRAVATRRYAGTYVWGLMLLLVTAVALQANAQDKVQAAIQKGVQLLQDEKAKDALREFERALEENDAYWPAYYYRAMALGMLGDEQGAQASFLRAAELSPGNAELHQRVAMSSFRLADFDAAWKHAILAHQGGILMTEGFDYLRRVSKEPADFNERVNAPRVFVEEPDIEGLMAKSANPWATSVQSRTDGVGGTIDQQQSELPSGMSGGPTSSSARATGVGQQALMIAQPDLYEMIRVTRQTVEESTSFGLVGRPDMARYVLVIDIDDLDGGKLDGYIKLKDPSNGEEVYRRVLELSDIGNRGDLNAEIRRNIGYVEEWLREQT